MQIDLSNIRKRLRRFKGVKLVSIILLLLMLGSTVTGYLLQAFSTSSGNDGQSEVDLPDTNIADYAFTREQKEGLLRSGKTVMEYRYQITCENCTFQRVYLESVTNEFPDQLFLQEIVDDSAARPTLEMSSFYGRRLIADPQPEDVLEALCSIMADPPVRCVTMGI